MYPLGLGKDMAEKENQTVGVFVDNSFTSSKQSSLKQLSAIHKPGRAENNQFEWVNAKYSTNYIRSQSNATAYASLNSPSSFTTYPCGSQESAARKSTASQDLPKEISETPNPLSIVIS